MDGTRDLETAIGNYGLVGKSIPVKALRHELQQASPCQRIVAKESGEVPFKELTFDLAYPKCAETKRFYDTV